MDDQEEEFLRAKAAWLLGRTLSLHSPGIDEALDALTDAVRRRNESLEVKVACIDALSRIGSRRILDLSASELPRLYMEPLLQERLLGALGRALAERGDTSGVAPPMMVSRVADLAFSQERPAEVRAEALVVLARFKKAQMAGALDLMPEIRGIVKFGQDPVLLLAAVQAAGILNDENTPTALVEAYRSLAHPAKAPGADDVRIRTQIVRSLGEWLSAQTHLRSPDAKGIRLIAGLLLEIAGPAKDNKETAVVRYETFLALRYLYPNRREFSSFHQGIVEQLMSVLREEPKADAELTAAVVETLTIISRYPGGRDLSAWQKWYSRTYRGSEIAKSDVPRGFH